jgi:hypothetical protein
MWHSDATDSEACWHTWRVILCRPVYDMFGDRLCVIFYYTTLEDKTNTVEPLITDTLINGHLQ